MCISNQSLKFLDILNFLAPGTSYAKFLKAYDTEEQKSFFPYEWFDAPEKLQCHQLPPYEAFYSQLKQSYVCTPEEYESLQRIWQEKEMVTFEDFLVYYNNLDVGPFVQAVEKMQTFYKKKHMDMFKVAITVPGLARRLLFQSSDTKFSLIDSYNQDLHYTIKKNIVGGPSIIFSRYHKAGETLIRGHKPCKKILGYDAMPYICGP